MSSSKHDRSTAPRVGSKPSKAKKVHDRNTTPPRGYHKRGKPKRGERAMKTQLEQAPAVEKQVVDIVVADDPPPAADLWWMPERETCYAQVLAGMPQHQIAKDLGRDRHTIARWCEDERFVERLRLDNESRFHSMRQRRAMQTVRLTDKVHNIANDMVDAAMKNPKDLGSRLAARDFLSEFREMGRREDEIYGLDKQRVDVNIHGSVQHQHKGGVVNMSFKEFLTGSMKKLGVDVENEEVDATRADEALIALTEKALSEGTYLDELVEREKQEALAPMLQERR